MAPRRREVLAGLGAATVGLAGCTSVEDLAEALAEATRPDGHPLDRDGAVTVAVVDRSRSGHDLGALTREALTFWETNDAEHVGFEVAFEVVSSDDPDVEVIYVDDRADLQGCEEYHTDNLLGCAPMLSEGTRFDPPATVEVVATDRPRGEVLLTAKHELGHVLGLGHDDEPAWVMSNDVEDRLPEYEHRIEALEAVEAVWETRNDGTGAYNEGIAHWNDEAYGRAVDEFERAERRYREIDDLVSTAREAATAFEEMERPDTVDRERLAAQFDRLEEMASILADSAAAMADAADAAERGDTSTARDRHRDATGLLDELRVRDFPTPADVAVSLGLVREDDDRETEAEPGDAEGA